MDVRIGLTQTPKELEIQLADDADPAAIQTAGRRRHRRRQHAVAHRPQGPPGRCVRRQAGLRGDRQPRTTSGASASAADVRPLGATTMIDLLDRKLLFVTGKGGVGKTTIAASLALLAAQHGKRTLVGEIDAKGNLADFYETGPTAFKEREVSPGLWAMSMDTEESLKEYLSLQLKVPFIARLGPLARTFDFVANAAPGVKEILTVGKFLWEVRERSYDLVVVDAVATGHITGQLAAPRRPSRSSSRSGMVRDQTGWMIDILGDPAQTGVVIVSAPEEMPVNETLELAERAAQRDRRRPRRGRRQPGAARSCSAGARKRCSTALDDEVAADRRCSRTAVGGPVQQLLDGAQLAVTLRRTRGVSTSPGSARSCPPARRCSTCRTSSSAATARGPRARSRRTSARSSGSDGRPARSRRAPPARSSSCWRPRRS